MSKKKKLIFIGFTVFIGGVIVFAINLFNDKPTASKQERSNIEQKLEKEKSKISSSLDQKEKETSDSNADNTEIANANPTNPDTHTTDSPSSSSTNITIPQTNSKTNTTSTNTPNTNTGGGSQPVQQTPTPAPSAPAPTPAPIKSNAPTSIGAIQSKVQSLGSFTGVSKIWNANGGFAVDLGGDYVAVGDPLIGIKTVDAEQKIFISIYSTIGDAEKALIRDILAVYYPNSYSSAYNDVLNAGGFVTKTYDDRYFATSVGGSGMNRGTTILIGY